MTTVSNVAIVVLVALVASVGVEKLGESYQASIGLAVETNQGSIDSSPRVGMSAQAVSGGFRTIARAARNRLTGAISVTDKATSGAGHSADNAHTVALSEGQITSAAMLINRSGKGEHKQLEYLWGENAKVFEKPERHGPFLGLAYSNSLMAAMRPKEKVLGRTTVFALAGGVGLAGAKVLVPSADELMLLGAGTLPGLLGVLPGVHRFTARLTPSFIKRSQELRQMQEVVAEASLQLSPVRHHLQLHAKPAPWSDLKRPAPWSDLERLVHMASLDERLSAARRYLEDVPTDTFRARLREYASANQSYGQDRHMLEALQDYAVLQLKSAKADLAAGRDQAAQQVLRRAVSDAGGLQAFRELHLLDADEPLYLKLIDILEKPDGPIYAQQPNSMVPAGVTSAPSLAPL